MATALEALGVEIADEPRFEGAELILDAIFGTGLNRPPEGKAAEWIEVINAAGVNVYDIQLFQVVGLTAGKTYTLTFSLKAEATSKAFKVVIEHNGDPWTNYLQQPLQFTLAANTWQNYTLTWIQPATDSSVKIGFHFGTFNTSDAWLDNVVLKSN